MTNTNSDSDLSRILYAKYREIVLALDKRITEVKRKHFVSFRINNQSFVGVMLQKSALVCDFKVNAHYLEDPKHMLYHISKVSTWTYGKSRMKVYDDHTLEYCVKITIQCYSIILERTKPILKRNQNTIEDSIIPLQTDTTDDIRLLAEQMVNERAINKKKINKHLRQRLTKEFVELRSVTKVIKNNPDLSDKIIRQHIRTSLRLPEELKRMENEGFLHPDPDCSLHLALYAVNHCQWDGEKEDEESVIQLARSLTKYLEENSALARKFLDKNSTSDKNYTNMNKYEYGENYVTASIAVWIATATLHEIKGTNQTFSNKEIGNVVIKQDICKSSRSTIAVHISTHCVASKKPQPNRHRKLYRVSDGRYRLYRDEDYYHPDRKNGQTVPRIEEMPSQFKYLVQWYNNEYCK